MKKQVAMDCVVVGGVADGIVIPVVMGAERIELARPTYAKPLESSSQKDIDVAKESDIYIIHPINLVDDLDTAHSVVYGIAVVEGMQLTEAYAQIITGFIQNATQQLLEENKKNAN